MTKFRVEEQQDLSALNSFAVAAKAAAFVRVDSVESLSEAVEYARVRQLPILVLGGGSNILFAADFPGLVIQLCNPGLSLEELGAGQVLVTASAAQNWHQFVRWCLKQGCYGIENLSLIPGSVGAAPVQNIGAYGVELQNCFARLTAFHLKNGELLEFSREDCEFGYRDSIFKHGLFDRTVILSVSLLLSRKPAVNTGYQGLKEELAQAGVVGEPDPRQVADAVCRIRRRKLPDPAMLHNAGSFFKNPVVSKNFYDQLCARFGALPGYSAHGGSASGEIKIPAAWLLEHCGFKGLRHGDVGTHIHQPLVIVNYGSATGQQVLDFALFLQDGVEAKFGIRLQPEVRIIR